MKIAAVLKKFSGSEQFYHCPVCHAPFSLSESGSFLCPNGHCFDLSSKGYVHLLPGGAGRDVRYGNTLFSSRSAVFQDGFYEPVALALQEMAMRFMPPQCPVLLDAGCGEGYYSLFLAQEGTLQVYGVDNAKEAILFAAKKAGNARFAVADLASLPIADNAVGILLNVLAPANYREFTRVLCRGGMILKVIPGEHYLRELRACVSGELQHKAYSNDKIIGHMAQHADIADHKSLQYTLPVTQEQLTSFYQMTPLTSHIPIGNADLSGVKEITIHLELLAAHPRKR
ncbi:putative RNA methyltransferase [Christensenella timonensis]|uniref:putative RNA methyltransferase n=1 Tax=Christensenella timonensis TaxID=1816678 RepID=UPI00082A3761|nr:methyltransferase domain-containing protein [Christensenella timonensis]